MAEKARSNSKGKAQARSSGSGKTQARSSGSGKTQARSSGSGRTQARSSQSDTTPSGGTRSNASSNGRGGMSAMEAVQNGREHLTMLLGRPVEAVLGVDREHGNWVLRAQVLELERVPNTTDVLGEYEAVLDKNGDIVRYSQTRRYHRGQVDSE